MRGLLTGDRDLGRGRRGADHAPCGPSRVAFPLGLPSGAQKT